MCVTGGMNHKSFSFCQSNCVMSVLLAIVASYFSISDCVVPNTAQAADYGTPVLVHLLFRHGDRTPIDPYPTDPYRNLSYWPEGYGQLTNIGKGQEFELGQWLRRRYGNFISDIYTSDDIYIRSTDVDRTLMSAETVLAALYPPEGRQRWSQKLGWQPIPVHTAPETDDQLLAGKKKCPHYEAEFEKVMNSKQMQKLNKKYEELYTYLTQHSGRKVKDVDGVLFLYDTLHIESLKNLTLPEWTASVFPTKMLPPATFAFKVPTLTKELKRLKGGPFVKEVITHILHKINDSLVPDRKMFMYSAHDDTIAAVLNTLHVFNEIMPPYSSAIVLELRINTQQEYEIMIFYRNSSAEDPVPLTIPGCSPACPVSKFLELTEIVVPGNWKEECQLSLPIKNLEFNLFSVITLAVSTILIILLILYALLGIRYCRKQNSDAYYYHRVQTES